MTTILVLLAILVVVILGSVLFDGELRESTGANPFKILLGLLLLPFVCVASLFSRKEQLTPEQEAAAERVLRPLLGESFTSGQRDYRGERHGISVQVPRDLNRIRYEIPLPEPLSRARSIRFREDGSVRRGEESVALLPLGAADAISRLGRLGCTELGFSSSEVMVQMPYGQTPQQFGATVADFMDAGDALASSITGGSRAVPAAVAALPYTSGPASAEWQPPRGSAGPPS
ncbi:MAG TPA: hypothetical protein PKB03_05765 [Baekduia sp.]|nr:hypothetical protein [Baekduia sp.]